MTRTDRKEMAGKGMLPTPQSRDWKSPDKPDSANYKRKKEKGWTIDLNSAVQIPGETSQLNPRFVMEMMGFPPDWTELPFLNGEQNQ